MFKKLVTDITYIHVVNEGWTYLASVMDLYDRKIIGWAYGKNITAELATQAVKNACLNISDTKGIILHSDYAEFGIIQIKDLNLLPKHS